MNQPRGPWPPPLERFVENIELGDGGCWLWVGSTDKDGYARFRVKGYFSAHRFAYELHRGPIPPGLTIDHLCRQRHCVNPDHMEVVTHKVNTLRGEAPSALNARKEYCAKGHPFDHANTYIGPKGRRTCRACQRAAVAAYEARKRNQAKESA